MSPFLYKGTTLAIFSLSGKIPVVNIWLIKTVTGWTISDLIDFNKELEIPSTPQLVLFSKWSITLIISISLIILKLKSGNVFLTKYFLYDLSGCILILLASSGPIFVKSELNWFAISVLSLKVLLFHVKKSGISVCFFVFIMLLIVDQVFFYLMFKILKTRSMIRLLGVFN